MKVAISTVQEIPDGWARMWRHARIWAVCWLIGQLALPSGDTACRGEEPQKDEQRLKTFGVCRKAWLENVESSWVGTGAAKYVLTIDGKDVEKSDVEVEVNQDKYRLKIECRENTRVRSDADSKIIIRDSSAVFCCFGADLKLGSKHILKERFPYSPPETTMFQFGPIRLMRMLNLGKIDETKIVAAKELDNGDIEVRYVNGRAVARLVCAKQFGYNYSLCEGYRGDFHGPVASTETINWKKLGDRWYVMQAVRWQSLWKDGKKVSEHTSSLTYTSFDPKSVPENKRFSLDSLGLAKGTRIQDRRAPGPVQDRYYKLEPPPKADETIEMLVDRMPIKP